MRHVFKSISPLFLGVSFYIVGLFILGAFLEISESHGESFYGILHPSPPSWRHLLGTSTTGQDILNIVLNTMQTLFLFLIFSVPVIFIFSITIGVVFEYVYFLRTWVPLARISEVINSIPLLMLLVILSYYQLLSSGLFFLLLFLFKWTQIAQMAQGISREIRKEAFVAQAQRLNFSNRVILQLYFFPKVIKSLSPQLPVLAISLFNYITILDFLGYSVLGGTISLGALLSEGKENLFAPWILLSGLFGIFLILAPFIVLSYNFLKKDIISHNGIRDV